MAEKRPQVTVPNLCEKHAGLLVSQCRFKESDPWRALIIAAQLALFQAATADPKTHERIGDDITKVSTLGCLACYKPDAFGEIVEAGKTRDLGNIKRLGERYVLSSAK